MVAYPCEQDIRPSEYDSFITKRNQLSDMKKMEQIGAEAYAEEQQEKVNGMRMTYLPYFTFVMYLINRGMGFTRALFISCDNPLNYAALIVSILCASILVLKSAPKTFRIRT